MRLSVLDQSVAVVDRPQSEAIRNTMALAKACEGWGYHRFWVSEHHANPTIVGTAPEILIAAIAATTSTIRVGSAGVMLPTTRPSRLPSSSACWRRSPPAASIWGSAARRAPTGARPSR